MVVMFNCLLPVVSRHQTVCAFLVCRQVALVDLLNVLGIRADGLVGHSVGELGCAYADGCLTAEQTVLAAYWRGRCVFEAGLPDGAMAAVGKMTAGQREQHWADRIIITFRSTKMLTAMKN